MKKLSLILSLFCFSAYALAATTPTSFSGYYSSLHPLKARIAKAIIHPPTDITISNASNNMIYAIVPNTPIHDAIYPGNNDHIYNHEGAFYTSLILQDQYANVFFNNAVCPLAVMTVYGTFGSYRVNVDNDLCN